MLIPERNYTAPAIGSMERSIFIESLIIYELEAL
jgi:hypothetical protein